MRKEAYRKWSVDGRSTNPLAYPSRIHACSPEVWLGTSGLGLGIKQPQECRHREAGAVDEGHSMRFRTAPVATCGQKATGPPPAPSRCKSLQFGRSYSSLARALRTGCRRSGLTYESLSHSIIRSTPPRPWGDSGTTKPTPSSTPPSKANMPYPPSAW